MTTKIVFLAKTNLNNDGRILNELKILLESFPNIFIDFILLPDVPVRISLDIRIKVHPINTALRHSKIFKIFTLFEFTLKALNLLFRLKPHILHVQDSSAILPALIYRVLKSDTCKIIYDDHEMPNENDNLGKKILNRIEVKFMKIADRIIFANEERMELLIFTHNLEKMKCEYFLNLPYFEEENTAIDGSNKKILEKIDNLINHDVKFIIHQGILAKERGRKKLAKFSNLLPSNIKILLLGGSRADFENFIEQNCLDKSNFLFVGSVNYLVLPQYWKRGFASIIMYLPTYINNRLCAPNRFYLSIEEGLPVIVNKENPVLFNFVKKYQCGFFIEDIKVESDFTKLKLESNANFSFNEIRKAEIKKIRFIYEQVIAEAV